MSAGATIAALPMYDLPGLRGATDAWWSAIAARLRRTLPGSVPGSLLRGLDGERLWLHPALLLAQTCGYPLRQRLGAGVRVLAAPCYAAPGCSGERDRSVVLVRGGLPVDRVEDLRGLRAVYNDAYSQSGYNALRHLLAPHARAGRFFAGVYCSGAHLDSMRWLARGQADVCAVDCVTYWLAARLGLVPDGLRVLTHTASAPSLPYVTAGAASPARVEALRAALLDAAGDAALAGVRQALGLDGFRLLDADAYAELDTQQAEAVAHGYPRLA